MGGAACERRPPNWGEAMRTKRIMDFEGIAPDGGTAQVPDGYAGLGWGPNAFAIDDEVHPGSGYVAAIRSGEAAGYTAGGRPVTFGLLDGASFGFRAFFAAAAWKIDLEVTVEGYRDGELVAVASFTLDPVGQRIRLIRDFDPDFRDVDMVSIDGAGGSDAGLGGYGKMVALDDLVLLV